MERTKTTAELQPEQFEEVFTEKIHRFRDYIGDITLRGVEVSNEMRRKHITDNLRFDEFCTAMKDIFGSGISSKGLKGVYKKLTTNPENDPDWGEIFDFGAADESESEKAAVTEQYGDVFATTLRMVIGDACGHQKRRDVVQALKIIPSIEGFVTLSQKGTICMWSAKFDLLATVELNQSSWTTGIDYLSVLRKVIVSCERSFCVWDNRSKGGVTSQSVFTIEPLSYYPTAICWVPLSADSHEDTLLFGDEVGNLALLTLSNKDIAPKQSRDNKKFVESKTIDPKNLSVPIYTRSIHKQAVVAIKYFPTLRCFASSSQDSDSAFVMEPIEKFRDEHAQIRTVAISKGVNAFEYCVNANVVATGGLDKVIRIWHPHLWSRPAGKMVGHLFSIVSICCSEADGWLISLCAARTFRVWDIQSYACLQVFADADQHPGERRIQCMLYDAASECLVSGSSIVLVWPLTRAAIDSMQVPKSHDRPLIQLAFNVPLNQLASFCSETIKIWDIESGRIIYQIHDLFENAEVAAVTVNNNGSRLAAGATDGTIKILDWATGQPLKWRSARSLTQNPDSDVFESDTELSIVAMQYQECDARSRYLIVLGWANRVRVFVDTDDDLNDLMYVGEMSDLLCLQPQAMSRMESASSVKTTATSALRKQKTPAPQRSSKKEQILATYKLSSISQLTQQKEETTVRKLITGATNGNLVMWDVDNLVAEKIGHLPPAEEDDIEPRGILCLIMLKYTPRLAEAKVEKQADSETAAVGVSANVNVNFNVNGGPLKANTEATNKTTSVIGSEQLSKPVDDKQPVPTLTLPQAEKTAATATATATLSIPTATKLNVHESRESSTLGQAKQPAAKLIYYDVPINYIVTGHEDGCMRFWDDSGRLLKTVFIPTRVRGIPIVQLCTDSQLKYLVVADARGFVSMWHIGDLWVDKRKVTAQNGARSPQMRRTTDSAVEDLLPLTQLVTWRAHTQRVVGMVYGDSQNAIYTASIDGSVRIWWGVHGTYVGYLGQFRNLKYPLHERDPGEPSHLPCDITEGAIIVKQSSESEVAKQQKAAQKLSDYRLVFDEYRWQDPTPRQLPMINLDSPQHKKSGIERTRSIASKSKKSSAVEKVTPPSASSQKLGPAVSKQVSPKKSVAIAAAAAPAPAPIVESDNRYFEALCKPKQYNTHLEAGPTVDAKTGAIYRALPVYRVRSPEAMRYPTGLMRKLHATSQGLYDK